MPKHGDYAGVFTLPPTMTTHCEIHPEVPMAARAGIAPPGAAGGGNFTPTWYCPRCAGEPSCGFCGRPW